MSDLGDIYDALQHGKRSNESLATWVHGAEASDEIKIRQKIIERGIAAYNRMERDLRDGRKHIDPPKHIDAPTSCYCSVLGRAAPCSYCTDQGDET